MVAVFVPLNIRELNVYDLIRTLANTTLAFLILLFDDGHLFTEPFIAFNLLLFTVSQDSNE